MIQIIEPNIVVSVDISTAYYQAFQNAVKYFISLKTPEEIEKINLEITNKNFNDEFTIHYITFLTLCKSFEEKANLMGHVKEISEEEFSKMITQNN